MEPDIKVLELAEHALEKEGYFLYARELYRSRMYLHEYPLEIERLKKELAAVSGH